MIERVVLAFSSVVPMSVPVPISLAAATSTRVSVLPLLRTVLAVVVLVLMPSMARIGVMWAGPAGVRARKPVLEPALYWTVGHGPRLASHIGAHANGAAYDRGSVRLGKFLLPSEKGGWRLRTMAADVRDY